MWWGGFVVFFVEVSWLGSTTNGPWRESLSVDTGEQGKALCSYDNEMSI